MSKIVIKEEEADYSFYIRYNGKSFFSKDIVFDEEHGLLVCDYSEELFNSRFLELIAAEMTLFKGKVKSLCFNNDSIVFITGANYV